MPVNRNGEHVLKREIVRYLNASEKHLTLIDDFHAHRDTFRSSEEENKKRYQEISRKLERLESLRTTSVWMVGTVDREKNVYFNEIKLGVFPIKFPEGKIIFISGTLDVFNVYLNKTQIVNFPATYRFNDNLKFEAVTSKINDLVAFLIIFEFNLPKIINEDD